MTHRKNNYYIKCTPSSLVQKFRMDQENYNFKRQEFIDEFSKQFLEALKNYPYKNPKTSVISYNNFKRVINEFRIIFNQTSLEKKGKALTEGLWNAFYAQCVIPTRKSLYPRVQDKIDAHKALEIGNRIKIS